MSNIETWPLPPKIGLSLSSALIMRRFFASWRLFFLMYCQSFLVTSVRGIGEAPTTGASCADGVIGFMNAGFGARLVFFAGAFFAAAFFLAVAIDGLLVGDRNAFSLWRTRIRRRTN